MCLISSISNSVLPIIRPIRRPSIMSTSISIRARRWSIMVISIQNVFNSWLSLSGDCGSNQYHSLFARFIWVCDLIPDLELPISGTTNLSLMIADRTEVGKVEITADFNGAFE